MGNFGEKAQEFGGKAKEAVGDAVGNEKLADEGRADQVKAEVKEKLDEVGDKAKEAADKVIGHFKKDDNA